MDAGEGSALLGTACAEEPGDPNDVLTVAPRDRLGRGGPSPSAGGSGRVSGGAPLAQWWSTLRLLGPRTGIRWSRVGLGPPTLAATPSSKGQPIDAG